MEFKLIQTIKPLGKNSVSDFRIGDRVLYVVTYAGSNIKHKDNQEGIVVRIGKNLVYVDYGDGKESPSKAKRLIKL